MAVFYICPVCKAKNEDHLKYCKECGTWLIEAKKANEKDSHDRLYVCAFCDTLNEPNRNACKKCLKPLFSTEYETKEVIVKRKKSSWKKVLGWLIIAFVVIGLIGSLSDKNQGVATQGAATQTIQTPPQDQTNKQQQPEKPKITKAKFDELKPGMSYEEVSEIIGDPGKMISETGFKGEKYYTVTYQYSGEGMPGANAVLTFQDNKLFSKAQAGLK